MLGGPHASALANELSRHYKEIDHILCGEGEGAYDSLFSSLHRGEKPLRIIHGPRIVDGSAVLSATSFTGKTINVNLHEQLKYITTSRGVVSGPSLCAIDTLGGATPIIRKASAVVDEICTAYNQHGIIYFILTDDSVMADRTWIHEFCSLLIERNIYAMWSIQSAPENIDTSTLTVMKNAGCERIVLMADSGSPRSLDIMGVNRDIDTTVEASKLIRSAGLYLSLFLHAGFPGEKGNDITKNFSLIKNTLPGDGIISAAVYHPGTEAYEMGLESGAIQESDMFERKDKSLYMRNDPEMKEWIAEIRSAFSAIRPKAWYREKDFASHHRTGPSWVTNILEGDFYLDEDDYRHAEQCYMRVVSSHPTSPWGYLRLGKLHFRAASFGSAESHFKKVTDIVPNYHGGWLKLAESRIAQGKRKEGKDSVTHSLSINPFDVRAQNLAKTL